MKQMQQFTAIIERDGDSYVSLCPELDIASQGDTVEDARNNLIEAIELFFEVADPAEIRDRLPTPGGFIKIVVCGGDSRTTRPHAFRFGLRVQTGDRSAGKILVQPDLCRMAA